MNKDLCNNPACSNYQRYARYCGHLNYSIPKVKEVNKISDNQKETLKEYKKVRSVFLKEHPTCQAQLEGCKGKATEIHHRAGKASRELYLETKLFLAVCPSCHKIIETNPLFSKQKGFSVSRLSKQVNKRA
jgi:hypothetical protein